MPDIGQLFPDTDPKWKGANSDTFIREAVRLTILDTLVDAEAVDYARGVA